MKCPRCQAENDAGARFCEECGARLEPACLSCGTRITPGKKFCRSCGAALATEPADGLASPASYIPKHLAERILTSRRALEGERKLVTVLFADLKGSMELLADRDPEEARRLLDPVLERMMEGVHRYEGTVNRVMGDGIMALFGAPLALEDHAVRACYAALRMQEEVKRYAEEALRTTGLPIAIRIGLNSGEVVIGAIDSDLHMDYTAIGRTVHLASRMESIAAPGSILLTAATLAQAEGYVVVKPIGPVPVKGLAPAIEVYELTGAAGVRSRFGAAAARGLTRFVGRDPELEQLSQALERARTGRGQIVAVVGEAGVGKSRLFWEFTHASRTQDCLRIESSSLPYGKATAFLPIIELLRSYFQIESRDETHAIGEKVVGRLLSLDSALEPFLSALLWILDVPVDDARWSALEPRQRRQQTLEGIKRVLLCESQMQPLILLFEDLHWIDAETQTFLDGLVDHLPGSRVLLLVNYRPEYRHGWGSKTYYRQLQVGALPSKSAEAALDAMLGHESALASLKRRIIERTDGNPFFIEEMVRSLVETGVLAGERGRYRLAKIVQGLQVPATAQGILAARIDRLDSEDKRLLQAAAVIGTDVPFALLQSVAAGPDHRLHEGLARLQASEFLYETRLFPDPEYTFRHALTHEVAYGSLLAERRRALHAQIVDAMEALYGGRLAERVEQLAHHAVRGELREKAVHYLRQAGLKAAARSALPEALAFLEQALAVVVMLPEGQVTLEHAFDIRLELRWVLHQLGDIRGALAQLREAQACAERLDDDLRRGRVCAFMTVTHSQLGELDEALASGTRALEIAEGLGDAKLRILAAGYLENAQYYRGEYERVIALAIANLAAFSEADDDPGLAIPASVFDRSVLVLSLAQLGRFDEAAAYEAEAIRLAEPTHHAYTIAEAHFAASQFHLLRGDWAKACALAERWVEVSRTGNIAVLLPIAITISAWALAQLGETSKALNRIREGEQLLERQAATGIVGRLGWAYCALGRACLLLGRLDKARRLGDRAFEFTARQPGFAAHAQLLLGDVATHFDWCDAECGEGHYRQALALAKPRRMRPLVAHGHLGLGRLCQHVSRRQEAQEHFATAMTMYREMGMEYWLGEAEAAPQRPRT